MFKYDRRVTLAGEMHGIWVNRQRGQTQCTQASNADQVEQDQE